MAISIKTKFRYMHGYDDEHKCGDCEHCVRVNAGHRTVYKCKVMGITSSTATDIRLKDIACRAWKRREDDT